jgi:hypothetical protein
MLAAMSDTLSAFRHQHNGWTPERKQRFLAHLASHGSVAAAGRCAFAVFHLKRAEQQEIQVLQRRIPPDSSIVSKFPG